jgi:branched-chain amino acid transport system ATP-binding protein
MALLETRALKSFYGDFQALYGIDTVLEQSETVAIIGANGAGKSTYLKSIAGLIRNEPGSVMFDGQPIGAMPAAAVMKLGISLVPEGRRLFPSLTVEENLLIGRFRSFGNGATPRARRCPAASSRWRRSGARSFPIRACCCATRSASASRRS